MWLLSWTIFWVSKYIDFFFNCPVKQESFDSVYLLVLRGIGVLDFKDDVVIHEIVHEIREVSFLVWLLALDRLMLCRHVHDVDVVEELSIEATEHHQAVAHEDAGVPSSGAWDLVTDFDLAPVIADDIVAVDVADVAVVPASQNKELILIHYSSCMSPSCAGYVEGDIHFCTNHFGRLWLDKVLHLKNVEVIQMDILRVAATKGDDLGSLNGIGSVEALRDEAFLTKDIWLVPFLLLEVESPQVVQIRAVWLATHDHHEAVHECRCMVSPWRWHLTLREVSMTHVGWHLDSPAPAIFAFQFWKLLLIFSSNWPKIIRYWKFFSLHLWQLLLFKAHSGQQRPIHKLLPSFNWRQLDPKCIIEPSFLRLAASKDVNTVLNILTLTNKTLTSCEAYRILKYDLIWTIAVWPPPPLEEMDLPRWTRSGVWCTSAVWSHASKCRQDIDLKEKID